MSVHVIGLVFLAVLLWGSAPVVEKLGFGQGGTDPFVALSIRSVAVIIGLLVIAVATGNAAAFRATNARAVLFFAASGLMAGLFGTWAYLGALKCGEASRIVPISASYPLVTALLSLLLLKEDFTLSRLVGTCFVVAGIWLLK
jgi:bacterial/archaeal transporter family protein